MGAYKQRLRTHGRAAAIACAGRRLPVKPVEETPCLLFRYVIYGGKSRACIARSALGVKIVLIEEIEELLDLRFFEVQKLLVVGVVGGVAYLLRGRNLRRRGY